MKQIQLLLLLILSWFPFVGNCQSLEYVKSLITKERYVESVKELQTLADTGNAEAQYLLAKMFFEGKGVIVDASQGIQYATLSANQRYEEGILLLVDNLEKIDARK